MKIIKLRAFFYIFSSLAIVHSCYADQNSSIIILKGNWQYKWGNSPVNAKGAPLWLNYSDNDTTWESINAPSDIAMVHGAKDLWISRRLGNYNIDNPAIFITRVEKIFEVYLGDKKIYSFGEFKPEKKIPLMGSAWHLIKLPDDYSGKMITFHIRTDYNYVGTYGEIRLGSIETILTGIVKHSIIKTVLGFVFIFSGIIFCIILIFRRNLKSLLGLILFQVSTGIWILANTELTLILINVPTILFYADHIALFSSAIGFFMFSAEIIEVQYKTILKRMVQIYFLYLLLAIIIDIAAYPGSIDMVAPFLALSAISGLILIYYLFVSARKGNREARILLSALAIYTVFILADIVNYFQNVVIGKGVYEIQYAHYGGLCFYILLCWIIVLRYISVNEQNITAKEEILKNQQRAFEAVRSEKAAQEQFAHNLITQI